LWCSALGQRIADFFLPWRTSLQTRRVGGLGVLLCQVTQLPDAALQAGPQHLPRWQLCKQARSIVHARGCTCMQASRAEIEAEEGAFVRALKQRMVEGRA
jgi:hypothetical protein